MGAKKLAEGDPVDLDGAEYEFYAPGDLLAANTMDAPHAVTLQKRSLPTPSDALTLDIPALSAGVITLQRK